MDLVSVVKRLLSKVVDVKNYSISIPPNPKMGDLSSAVAFEIAKKKNKDPKEVAESIAKKIKSSGFIKDVKAFGPYINFFFDREKFSRKVIKETIDPQKPKSRGTICLDFFGPNAMKGIHIGHVRNAVVGACLHRLLLAAGYKVKTVSFGCDIGLPVAKVIWGYMNLGLKPEGEKGEWIGKIYAIANDHFKEDLKSKEQIYAINKKLYTNDEHIMKVYNQLISWSYDYIKKIEQKLRINVQKYFWETGCVDPALKEIKLLKKAGLAKDSDGALIIDLKKYGLGIYVLLTSQGVPTYEAKDLGLHRLKSNSIKADKYVIFTGAEQVMHFKQLIKTLELIGYPKNSIIHQPYEEVILEGKKISSREGNVILANELIKMIYDAAMNEVVRKNPLVADKEVTAMEIGLSSLFYGMIKQDMKKKINFMIDDWVRFDGDTGAYLQYSYVRARKILSEQKLIKSKFEITKDEEFELIKKLNDYDSVLSSAASKFDSSLIAHYAFDLANTFSKFYQQCPVIKPTVNQSRLLIVKAFESRMKQLMNLMGFKPLKEM